MKRLALFLALVLFASCGHMAPMSLVTRATPGVRRLTWIDRLPAMTIGQATPEYKTSCITPMSRRFVSGPAALTGFAVCVAEYDEQIDENPEFWV